MVHHIFDGIDDRKTENANSAFLIQDGRQLCFVSSFSGGEKNNMNLDESITAVRGTLAPYDKQTHVIYTHEHMFT